MSRGPGKTERAIEELIRAHPDNAYTVADLCRHIYGTVEKSQRVAVLRAMKKVNERTPAFDLWQSEMRGKTWVIFDHTNIDGYGMARMKTDTFESYDGCGFGTAWRKRDGGYLGVNGANQTESDLRKKLQERFSGTMSGGGAWWLFCEEFKANAENDTARLQELAPMLEKQRQEANAIKL